MGEREREKERGTEKRKGRPKLCEGRRCFKHPPRIHLMQETLHSLFWYLGIHTHAQCTRPYKETTFSSPVLLLSSFLLYDRQVKPASVLMKYAREGSGHARWCDVQTVVTNNLNFFREVVSQHKTFRIQNGQTKNPNVLFSSVLSLLARFGAHTPILAHLIIFQWISSISHRTHNHKRT